MISSSELRIGNKLKYQKYPQFEFVTVHRLSVGMYPISVIINPAVEDNPENGEGLEGIPLNEEWLLRAGFTKNPISWHKDISDFPKKEFKVITVSLNQGIFIRCGDLNYWREEDEVISLFNIDVRGPLYVNHLQNCWHLLTGTELEFKTP